jgi:hypothetical protein
MVNVIPMMNDGDRARETARQRKMMIYCNQRRTNYPIIHRKIFNDLP